MKPGVYQQGKQFATCITINGSSYYLGVYKTEEEASRAFNEFYLDWYGMSYEERKEQIQLKKQKDLEAKQQKREAKEAKKEQKKRKKEQGNSLEGLEGLEVNSFLLKDLPRYLLYSDPNRRIFLLNGQPVHGEYIHHDQMEFGDYLLTFENGEHKVEWRYEELPVPYRNEHLF